MATINGTPANETLEGSAADDDIQGYAGNDSIVGGLGFDRAVYWSATGAVNVNLATGRASGADGSDTLVGIEGIGGSGHSDVLTGSTNDWFEMFTGSLGDDTIDGGAITTANNGNRASYQSASGAVTVDLQAGSSSGADGNDRLININHVRGSNFDDALLGSGATNYTEFFEGRGGNDFIDGRGGFDFVRFDAATSGVHVNLADGRTYADGHGSNDTLVGIEGIQGTSFNDTLIGGNPSGGVVLGDGLSEVFRGGAGNDTIDGGQGYDRADYETSTAGVLVNLGTNSAQDGLGGTDALFNVEAVRGSSHSDTFIGSNAEFESYEGGAGDDSINGNGGWDRLDYRSLPSTGVNVDLASGTASDGQGGTDTFSSIEGVRGSAFNDTIAGDSNDNKLEGLGGDDSVSGGDGHDSLEGGDGNDTLLGGDGSDDIRGGAGNDSIDGGAGDDQIVGGAGADTLNGGAGRDWVNYWDATAAVSVNLATGAGTGTSTGSDKLSGFESASGSNFNDTLTGDANNNDFNGGQGNDSITGGGGQDRVGYWGASGAVTVNLVTGRATGADGNDTLVGISGATGSAFDDSLLGSNTDNTFEGGSGNDTIDGAGGNDWVWYGGSAAGVSVDLEAGTAADGLGGTDTLTNLENIAGSRFSDTLVGSSAANTLVGEGGDDAIDGGAGNDWINGGAGNDTILGSAGSDFMQGGQGNDSINGGAVTDRTGYTDGNTLSYEDNTNGIVMDLSGITGDGSGGVGTVTDGWGGTDTVVNVPFIRGSAYADSILGSSAEIFEMFEGGAGNDTINGGVMNFSPDGTVSNGNRVSYQNAGSAVSVDLQAGTATGGAGNDVLSNLNQVRGSSYADILLGAETTDYVELFEGRGGNDTIDGRGGFDIARYDFAPTTTGINVNLATNTAGDGQGGTDKLYNIEGVYGTGFADTLVGDAANNRLEGRGGNDSISGGLGKDTLLGGSGNDTLDGGDGVDAAGFQYAHNEYAITRVNDTDLRLVRGSDTTILRNVEYLGFSSGADVRTLQDILGNTPSDFSDTLTGTAGDDSLSGGKGNDLISGLAGNDTLSGGEGNDTLVGGLGDDRYVADSLNDVITEAADEGEDSVQVTLASGSYALGDHVENATVASSGAVGLVGNALANQLVGNAVANALSGNGGNDLLQGLAGNDTLSGGDGSDTLEGGVGADRLVGGAGDDIYVVDVSGDVLVEGLGEGVDAVQVAFTAVGTYVLASNVEHATVLTSNPVLAVNLTGNDSGNALTGNAGNNVLSGLAGDDTLMGSLGADTVDGGLGNDTLVLAGNRNQYTVTRTATDTVLARTGGGETVTFRGVESVQFGDVTQNMAQVLDNSISAFNDTVQGTASNDSIDGLAGNDSISGLGGNDTLVGGLGSDTLVGGLGDDTYTVDVLTDVVVEASGEGTDLVNVSMASGAYTLGNHVENGTVIGTGGAGITGNALDNVLTGNTAANTLTGGGGNDTLDGGAGSDRLIGGDGNDTYKVDATSDVIVELAGQGTDSVEVRLTTGTYILSASVENATVMNALNVNVTGSGDNNVLTGGAGNNVLSGMAGDDTLVGGLGNDTLDGGAGTDLAVFDGALADYTISRPTVTDVKLVRGGQTTIVRGVENFQFSDGVKTLGVVAGNTPSTLADTLEGTAGNDAIDGLAGNDSISGLGGNDTLVGGAGSDTLVGGLGDDTYTVDALTDVVVEASGEGADLVNVSMASGAYTLGNHVENGTVIGTGGAGITGNALDNVLTGNTAANTLTGGGGNDTLDGGAGSDRLIGGDGDDTYKVDATGDVIVEVAGQGTDSVEVRLTTGTYILSGGVENATVMNALNVNVTGSGDNNVLTGGAGNNVLNGMAGNDTLAGGLGNDTLDGGTGTDLAVFDGAFADYTISRPTATDIKLVRGGQTITVRGVESFEFTDGVKTLGVVAGNTPSTLADTLEGTAGNDAIDGLAGNDSISGLGGNDTLVGGAGSDTLVGGLGDDTYTVDALTDVVVEASGEGADLVNVSMASGAYTLGNHVENGTVIGTGGAGITGNALDNVLTGNTAANTLTGGGGNDTLDGGAGSDRLIGGDGDDTYKVDATGDVIVEVAGQGTDSVEVRLTTGTYILSGGVENATVMNALNVNVTGSGDNNVLTGGAGNNVLNGMAGNDTLIGGLGNDTLTGGAGADTFVFDAAFGLSNQDRITDFVTAQGDKIALSAAVFTQLGAAGTPVVLGGDYLQYSTVTGALTYDADGVGGGSAVTLVVLGTTTHPALTGADLVLIA